MKITINRKNLLDALAVGGAMAGKTKTVPILEMVLIRVADNYLTVVSSNSESQVLKRVEIISSDGNIDFCTNPNDLSKALKTLTTENVVLDANTDTVTVAHNKGSIEFPACSSVAFPVMAKTDNVSEVTIPSALLKDWINIARNFASNDTFKPVMNGMFLTINGNTITVCATDAHKLFSDSNTFENVENTNLSVIIPASVFPMILNVLNDCENVKLALDTKNVSFRSATSKVTARAIEGAYPNFDAVIPKTHNIEVVVDKKELKQAISRAGLFTNQSTSLVKLAIADDKMGIAGQDINFAKKSTEVVEVEHIGNDLEIGVKGDYAEICLNTIAADKVRILLIDQTRPIIFKDDEYPNMTQLLMPMLLS